VNKKNIVVVGAGGFALELLGYLEHEQSIGRYINYVVKGVIDDSAKSYEGFSKVVNLAYLGTIDSYVIDEKDVFWVAIGSQPHRRNVTELLAKKYVTFFSFISSMAVINKTARLGEGIVIAPFCIVNANVKLGNYAMLNSFSCVGHDSVVGDHAILYPYAAINGNCHVGADLLMGTRATIFPGTKVGNNCTITSHSYVKTDKGDNRFIHLKAKEVDLENRL
jgi:hypothetical protein